jgi:hypothetical protein
MGPKIAFFTGRAAVANQTCPATTVCMVTFAPGPFDFNDGGAWDGSAHFDANVAGAVYQYDLVIGYESGTPGTVFQVFLRGGGGDFTRYQTSALQGSLGTVTLTANVKAVTYGAGPIWVEVYSSNGIEISRFTSQFSAHLVYAP